MISRREKSVMTKCDSYIGTSSDSAIPDTRECGARVVSVTVRDFSLGGGFFSFVSVLDAVGTPNRTETTSGASQRAYAEGAVLSLRRERRNRSLETRRFIRARIDYERVCTLPMA